MYAVNVSDLTELPLAGILFGPVIQNRQIVDAEHGQMDGTAVVMDCPDERAEAIREVVKMKGARVRFYKQGTRGGWAKVR